MKKYTFLIFALCLYILHSGNIHEAFCGDNLTTAAPHIIGGNDTKIEDYPWVVAIVKAEEQSPFLGQYCGGTLIGQRWVLTAAHCTYNQINLPKLPREINVIVGSTLLSSSAEDRNTINRIIRHPRYQPGENNYDIALLELASSTVKRPISLFSGLNDTLSLSSLTGKIGNVLGWGITSKDEFTYATILQRVKLPIVSSRNCSDNAYGDQITKNMLCAGYLNGTKDSCHGDSGGPLVVSIDGKWVQAGIVSWGEGCAQNGYYGVYTRTSSFIYFIAKYVHDATFYPKPNLVCEPKEIRFNNFNPESDELAKVSLKNLSNIPIAIQSVYSEKPIQAPFSINIDNCSNQLLQAQEHCEITIKHTSTGRKNYSDHFVIMLGDSFTFPITIQLHTKKQYPWNLFFPAISNHHYP